MSQQVRFRPQSQARLAFSANNRDSEQLSRGMIYRELILRLRGTITTDAAFAPLTDVRPGDEWGVVRKIDMVANGSDHLRNLSGEELRMLNLFQYGTIPHTTPAFTSVTPGQDVIFDSTLILPFWMPRSIRAIDTALDSRSLSSLTIEVTWGDVLDVIDTAGTVFNGTPTLDVYSLESFGVKGPFSQTRYFRVQESNVTAQSEFQIDLPVGPMYRTFLINAKDADGNDLPDAIDNVKIRAGTTVFYDLPTEVARQWQRMRTDVQAEAYDTANDVLSPWFISGNTDPSAWQYIDLVTDGYLSESIDTLGFSELLMELDINQTIATLNVIPLQIIPVRQRANMNNGNGRETTSNRG